MANWQGVARTNYFPVNDPEAFKARMAAIGLEVITGDDLPDTYGLLCSDGGWPNTIPGEDYSDDAEQIDLVAEVASFLTPGSVAVFMESGFERMRYVSGQSLAVNSEGEVLEINLNDIYSLVESKWGTTPSKAEY